MDIGGVNKFKVIMPSLDRLEVERNKQSNSDRDANGRRERQEQPLIEQLSAEQEERALKKLNAQDSFVQSGLKAELVREDGKPPHILVKKTSGEVIRRLPYSQIVSLFLNEQQNNSGLLINRKA